MFLVLSFEYIRVSCIFINAECMSNCLVQEGDRVQEARSNRFRLLLLPGLQVKLWS